jgi:tetratricopeptide (TPR) repeat protein
MDDDLLDEILDEVEALGNQLPGETLALLFEERARGVAPGAPGRAAWLSHAGERWEMEGDLARAKACFEQAAQDGGEAYLDPRAGLVNVLLRLGENSRADEVLADLRRDLKAGWSHRFLHETVGESLELNGRLQEALRWFTAGLTHAEREDPEAVDIGCLNGRFRVRRALGLPLDRYDELCEERRRQYEEDVEGDEPLLQEAAGKKPPLLTVLYWPPTEFALLLGRWPDLADDYGSTHAEHRSVVERHLREVAASHGHVTVGPGDFAEYLEFAERRDDHAANASTRAGGAAHLGRLDRVVAWPPRRNDRCWCGSGLKYKKCCGALRFDHA